MTPGQLVKAVSIALDVPEEAVVQHDRNLVVAGLRTTGARGRNAPAVTPLDAARVFVATLGSVRAKDSAATVRSFEEAIFRPPLSYEKMAADSVNEGRFESAKYALAVHESDKHTTKFSDQAIEALPLKHNFVEAIASLISDASLPIEDLDQYFQRFAELIVDTDNRGYPMAHIGKLGTYGGSYSYECKPNPQSTRAPPKAQGTSPAPPRYKRYARSYGISQRRSVFGSAIMLLGKAFRDDGLPFETTRDAIDALVGSKKAPSKSKRKAA